MTRASSGYANVPMVPEILRKDQTGGAEAEQEAENKRTPHRRTWAVASSGSSWSASEYNLREDERKGEEGESDLVTFAPSCSDRCWAAARSCRVTATDKISPRPNVRAFSYLEV
eukprot:751752-Hanusia_phi.AAC.1